MSATDLQDIRQQLGQILEAIGQLQARFASQDKALDGIINAVSQIATGFGNLIKMAGGEGDDALTASIDKLEKSVTHQTDVLRKNLEGRRPKA